MELTLLILVILFALAFEYINGFHDAANAIATVVSTKVLSPRSALIFGATLNFIGALSGTHVAKTIGGGLVDTASVTQLVIICALAGAIVWNLITWWYGIPSSSSHALIGGLLGAAIARSGWSTVKVMGVVDKVIIPMLTSPLMGLLFGFFFMMLLLWIFHRSNPDRVNTLSRKMQLVSAGFMAFSHGSNDAQKTMGIITLALFSYGAIHAVEVPIWVILICALCMGIGTMGGGWRIIRTMGTKVIKLKPIHGFAAETAAAGVIYGSSLFGVPVSTTHIISTAIMGVGTTRGPSAVKWGLVGTIVQAWILTLPICMALSYGFYRIVDLFMKLGG